MSVNSPSEPEFSTNAAILRFLIQPGVYDGFLSVFCHLPPVKRRQPVESDKKSGTFYAKLMLAGFVPMPGRFALLNLVLDVHWPFSGAAIKTCLVRFRSARRLPTRALCQQPNKKNANPQRGRAKSVWETCSCNTGTRPMAPV